MLLLYSNIYKEAGLEEDMNDEKPEYNQGLIKAYTEFKSKVHNPRSVFYPCSATDASATRVFNNVTHLDLDEHSMKILRANGLKAITGDVREYSPKELHDLLILLNPAIRPEWATSHIPAGAFIIANNYHGTSSDLSDAQRQYELFGTLSEPSDGRAAVFSRDLTDLFIPVKSGDELRALRPGTFDFVMKSYPHLLKMQGIKPEETFEALFRQYQKLLSSELKDEDIELPARRIADLYIFRKK